MLEKYWNQWAFDEFRLRVLSLELITDLWGFKLLIAVSIPLVASELSTFNILVLIDSVGMVSIEVVH